MWQAATPVLAVATVPVGGSEPRMRFSRYDLPVPGGGWSQSAMPCLRPICTQPALVPQALTTCTPSEEDTLALQDSPQHSSLFH